QSRADPRVRGDGQRGIPALIRLPWSRLAAGRGPAEIGRLLQRGDRAEPELRFEDGGAEAGGHPQALDGGEHALNSDGGGRADFSSLTASQAEELDLVCDRFEAEWKAGKRPNIEDHSEGLAEPLRSALREYLIAVERHWRERRGERTVPSE